MPKSPLYWVCLDSTGLMSCALNLACRMYSGGSKRSDSLGPADRRSDAGGRPSAPPITSMKDDFRDPPYRSDPPPPPRGGGSDSTPFSRKMDRLTNRRVMTGSRFEQEARRRRGRAGRSAGGHGQYHRHPDVGVRRLVQVHADFRRKRCDQHRAENGQASAEPQQEPLRRAGLPPTHRESVGVHGRRSIRT